MQSSTSNRSLEARLVHYQSSITTATVHYLRTRGIDREAAGKFRLGQAPSDDPSPLAGRLVIPYLTPVGVVALKGRCIEDHDCKDVEHHAKYINLVGQRPRLFNAQSVLQANGIITLCEGEIDSIMVESRVGFTSVSYPGTETWKKNRHWPYVFDGCGDSVVVIADGDEAGRRSAGIVSSSIRGSRVIEMPPTHDSGSFIHEFGPDAFRERVSG